MNYEQQLKCQAWLDGELPSGEAARFERELASIDGGPACAAQLRAIKTALKDNELSRPVPATREFYWNQIQRQIQRESPRSQATIFGLSLFQWRRFLMPLAGAAATAALLLVSIRQFTPATDFTESADTATDMESMTFHDQTEGVTVVWLQDSVAMANSTDNPISSDAP
jgi:anti-sigma factor RsiW